MMSSKALIFFSQARAAFANSALSFLQVGTICEATYFKTEIPTFKHNNYCTQIFIETFQKYNFDGLDLDWEYPGIYIMEKQSAKMWKLFYLGKRGGSPEDKENFILLIKVLEILAIIPSHNPKVSKLRKCPIENFDVHRNSKTLNNFRILKLPSPTQTSF